jgi:hypothetical protein
LTPSDLNIHGKINLYIYDGCHEYSSHISALTHFIDSFDDEFIFIVDDWNNLDIRNATMQAIRNIGLIILYMRDVFTMIDNGHPPMSRCGKSSDWHNGMGVFVLRKKL